jgi:hypothetical protein
MDAGVGGGGGASQDIASALGYFEVTIEDMREIYRILVINVTGCKHYYSVLNTLGRSAKLSLNCLNVRL